MTSWKQIAVKSFGFGAGVAIVIALIGAGVAWYLNRPIPWDTTSITSEYSHVDTTGEKNTFVLDYTLSNNTNTDYSISEYSKFPIFANLKDSGQLSGSPNDEFLSYQKPIFIPPGRKLRFLINLKYPYPIKAKKKQSKEERKQYRKNIEKYMNEKFSNLNGFTLFDKDNHYEIQFENGWLHTTDDDFEKE